MDLNYINPFIQSAIEIIKETMNLEVVKKDVYVQKGRKSKGGVGIVLDVSKSVSGRIIFDFTQDITKTFAREMVGLSISDEKEMMFNKELLESAIKELGNMISGRAITILEENNYNCSIAPPKVYLGKNKVLAEQQNVCIVIDFNSKFGDFALCLTNKDDAYLDNVVMALSNINEYIQDALVYYFLPKGFELLEINDINKLKRIIATKSLDFLIINSDKFEDNLLNTIKSLKESSKNDNLKIIPFSSRRDRSIFEDLFDKYISFVLPSYFNEAETVEAMKKFFEASGIRHTERRKHIRVDIEDTEFVKVTLPIEQGVFLEGHIKNLSIGGALFQANNGKLLANLNVGSRISGLQMSIGGRIARTSAVVVYKKEFHVAIRFIELKENFLKVVAKYIFKKLSDSVDKGLQKGID